MTIIVKGRLTHLIRLFQYLHWGLATHTHPKLMTYLLEFRYPFSREQDATLSSAVHLDRSRNFLSLQVITAERQELPGACLL